MITRWSLMLIHLVNQQVPIFPRMGQLGRGDHQLVVASISA